MDKPVSTAQQQAINAVVEMVADNTESITSINDTTTGILAQAKAYTDLAVGNADVGVVSSVNGRTGAVVLDSSDIPGLDDALNEKMPIAGGTFTGRVKLGLGSATTSNGEINYLMLRNIAFSTTAAATQPAIGYNGDLVFHYG